MNFLSKLHPLVLLVWYAAALACVLTRRDPVAAAAFCASGILVSLALAPERRWRRLGLTVLLAAAITALNPVFVHRGATPLFFIGDNAYTLEALVYGAAAAANVLAVLGLSVVFSRLLTSDKLFYLVGRLSPKAGLMLSATMRYIPMLTRRALSTSVSRRAAGLAGDGRLLEGGRVFLSVGAGALETSVETAMTMRSRGWGSRRGRLYSRFRLRAADFVSLAVIALLTAASILTRASSEAFDYYPRVDKIPLDAPVLIGLACAAALCVLPAAVAAAEELRWKRLLSAI